MDSTHENWLKNTYRFYANVWPNPKSTGNIYDLLNCITGHKFNSVNLYYPSILRPTPS